MQMDPNPPDFSGVKYDVGIGNTGEAFAKGMQAGSAAGEAIGKGITTAADLMRQRQTATDTLNAMHGTGMLSDDAYKAIAGKSLGAQQAMIGTYAGEWIAQQAQARALQEKGYGANLDIWKQHAALLDQIAQYQGMGLYPPGADKNKVLIQGGQGGSGGSQTVARALPANAAPPVQQAQPAQQALSGYPLTGAQGPLPPPRGLTPAMTQRAIGLAGTPGAPQPLGSGNIYSPGPKLGSPISSKGSMPAGSTIVQGTGPGGQTAHFLKLPDGTLQPIQD